MNEAKRAVTMHENAKKGAERAIQNFYSDIDGIKKRVRQRQAQAAQLRAKKNPKRPVSQLPQLREKMDELQAMLQQVVDRKEKELEPDDREKGRERDDAAERLKIMENKVARHQEDFDRLDSVNRGNSLSRFGNDVPRIAAAFKAAERQFPPGKAPVGPVGVSVKLKDPKWGKALCDAAFRAGQTWLVHSVEDMKLCRKILRDKNISEKDAEFYTLNPDEFDVKVGSASELSVLDTIEIDHPNKDCRRFIRNFLVDRFKLNEVRVAEEFLEAKVVAERPAEQITLSNGVRHELRRICYSLDGSKTKVERKQEGMKGGGGVKSMYVPDRQNPYDTDVSERRAQVQEELVAAKEARDDLKRTFDDLAAKKKEAMKAVAAAMKEQNDINKRMHDVRAKIDIEEKEQAKWRDEDDNDQDQEIRELEDTSALQEVGLRSTPCHSITDMVHGVAARGRLTAALLLALR